MIDLMQSQSHDTFPAEPTDAQWSTHHGVKALHSASRTKFVGVFAATAILTAMMLVGLTAIVVFDNAILGGSILWMVVVVAISNAIYDGVREWRQWKMFLDTIIRRVKSDTVTCDCQRCVAWRTANNLPQPSSTEQTAEPDVFIVGDRRDIGPNPRYWN
jgi:hypothetical protein